ncbi:putative glycosyltransferase [Plesiocystis pacifica SIR-1]|uniref:Putative glycosyltransferase n=1 Tax=Plesiocystis pacifica SIR-1 TaxID=391625 RepID=A6G1Y5_9BACT|nr:glycosyltransferase family 2 protein [Plesiocystis pacifica]EDM80175.1 putative glycosyltransferase [Plesiocystis pacifica SIR-1]
MPRLSAIIPVRNRSGTRLRNCLASLRWQQLDAAQLEIVLSDFGSNEAHAASIRELAEQFDARIARTDEYGDWNRSRALNLGIQHATGEYMFCTDADMIFAPNFVPALLAVHDRLPGKALVLCACSDLPQSVPERDYTSADLPYLHSHGKRRKSIGTGACQSATREFFFHSRGYDENFVHWGSEDTDMRDRALRYGLEAVWISEQTEMFHQWHPTSRYSRLLQNRKNAIRYWFTRGQIVKNLEGWGKLS